MAEETTFGSIAAVLLILAAVVVLLLFMTRQLHAGDLSVDEQQCRDSIALHSQVVHLEGEGSAPPIKCAPKVVTVDNRDPDKAKQQIADQMVFCWDRWQQGQAELFETKGTYCNPCTIMDFRRQGPPIGGLTEYLESNKIPGKTVNYSGYLFPTMTAHYTGASIDLTKFLINTTQTYAVIFVYDKNNSLQRTLDVLKQGGNVPASSSGAVAGAIHGAGVGASLTAGGIVLLFAACVVVTGGACGIGAPVIGSVIAGVSATTVLSGTVIGAGVGAYNSKTSVPEWFATVLVVPHNSTVYRDLGCTDVNQAGVPQEVDGAENI